MQRTRKISKPQGGTSRRRMSERSASVRETSPKTTKVRRNYVLNDIPSTVRGRCQ
jgi:hypothetical protein